MRSMSRSGRGSRGNLFGDSGPEDAVPEDETLPELGEILHTRRPKRRTAPGSAFRAASAFTFSAGVARRQRAAGGRRWLLWLRVCISALLLLFGLIGVGVGISQTASGYSDAGTMAHAPVCAQGVDVTSTTENCVGTLNLVSEYGVLTGGDEEEIGLDLPPAGSANYAWVTFPGNAQFDAAVGYGPSVVRAEFWKGQLVTLTAGAQGVTVTTDLNPNNVGGSGLGITFMSFALVLLSLLLVVGIRAFRERWLRPGIMSRLIVSGLIVWFLGFFIAGICLMNQPALVAPVLAIAPVITVVLLAGLWFLLVKVWKGQVRQGYAYR